MRKFLIFLFKETCVVSIYISMSICGILTQMNRKIVQCTHNRVLQLHSILLYRRLQIIIFIIFFSGPLIVLFPSFFLFQNLLDFGLYFDESLENKERCNYAVFPNHKRVFVYGDNFYALPISLMSLIM